MLTEGPGAQVQTHTKCKAELTVLLEILFVISKRWKVLQFLSIIGGVDAVFNQGRFSVWKVDQGFRPTPTQPTSGGLPNWNLRESPLKLSYSGKTLPTPQDSMVQGAKPLLV